MSCLSCRSIAATAHGERHASNPLQIRKRQEGQEEARIKSAETTREKESVRGVFAGGANIAG